MPSDAAPSSPHPHAAEWTLALLHMKSPSLPPSPPPPSPPPPNYPHALDRHHFPNRSALLAARDAWCDNSEAAKEVFGQIRHWDVSAVTDLSWAFCACDRPQPGECPADCNAACASFNDDITEWDVSRVTRFRETFRDAGAFNQPIGGWDTSSATTMRGIFDGAYAFNHPLERWDTSRVTSLQFAFRAANAFNAQEVNTKSLDVWNTSRVVWVVRHGTPSTHQSLQVFMGALLVGSAIGLCAALIILFRMWRESVAFYQRLEAERAERDIALYGRPPWQQY